MFKQRVLTVAVLLPAFVACAFLLPTAWWALVMFLAVVLAAREWSGLGKFQVLHSVALYFFLSLACLALWFNRELTVMVYALSVVLWIVAVPLLLWRRMPMRANAVAVLGGILVLVPLWLAMVQLQENPALMLALLAWLVRPYLPHLEPYLEAEARERALSLAVRHPLELQQTRAGTLQQENENLRLELARLTDELAQRGGDCAAGILVPGGVVAGVGAGAPIERGAG